MKQNLQQWQQLNSDLSDVSTWLDKTEEELEELQKAKPPTSMHEMEQRVKKLKVSCSTLRNSISKCRCSLLLSFVLLWFVNCMNSNNNVCMSQRS